MIRPIDIMLSFSCTVMGSNCIVTGYAITMTYSHGIVIELQNPAHPTNAYFVSLALLATGRFRPLTAPDVSATLSGAGRRIGQRWRAT